MNAGRIAATPTLLARARASSAAESAGIVWLQGLDGEERALALRDLKVVQIGTGELLCRVGRPAT
jgi:CRP/FNR family transcriptional regulator, cyclic AMP receptor protein